MTTKTAALELAPHGIRVNCICPGATKPVYDRHMIDVVIDRWDEFAKKLKNGKAPVFTICSANFEGAISPFEISAYLP